MPIDLLVERLCHELSILFPSNATVTDSSVKISGLPYGSGDLDDYVRASPDTNGGSTSQAPSLSMLGDDYYVVWSDNGDLDEQDTNIDAILFRAFTGGSWEDTIALKTNDGVSSEIYSFPRVKSIEDGIFAA